ncbi:MAG TPA: aminotransferase class I/II-fold pyridoxal phosphate-dependent enzyme, partial [Ilumatobacteraceae bacterium]|nr:aminotransferase class I/II-fold pyridoxal phosphate-dependent enzyme [Ilumatobacteraceae bacterium]
MRSTTPADGGPNRDVPSSQVGVELVVGEVTERTARGIAAAVNRLITSRHLPEGSRLPTVRQVARAMSVSPTTVSDAWQMLAAIGAVEGRGRQGTFVRAPVGPGAPVRYRRITEGPGHFTIDLSSGIPDAALLPNVAAVIASLPPGELTASYLDPAVLPALEAHLIAEWPFVPEAFTVVDGAMDALDRVAQQTVRMGDRVIVENPTFPPMLDLLDHLGAEVIGVPLDESGIIPAALAAALDAEPVALFCQPRAHNPTGVSTTAERAA